MAVHPALPAAPLIVAEGSVATPSSLQPGAHAVSPLREPDARAIPLYELLAHEIEAELRGPTFQGWGSTASMRRLGRSRSCSARCSLPVRCAETLGERQILLREANLAQVEQVRGFFARPWASGDTVRPA